MHDGPFEEKQSRAPGSITSTGIKGDRLLSSFVITFAYMKKPCHAGNPACAVGRFFLSCDRPRERSRPENLVSGLALRRRSCEALMARRPTIKIFRSI